MPGLVGWRIVKQKHVRGAFSGEGARVFGGRWNSIGVPVVYLTAYGNFVAAVMPTLTKNVLLRVNQFKMFADPQRALTLAKAVVKAKLQEVLDKISRADVISPEDKGAALARINRMREANRERFGETNVAVELVRHGRDQS